MGVRRCSPYDDTCYRGRSDVYDDDTLRYATDVMCRHDGDLLLWVNLLALRDIDYVRTSSSTASSSTARWLDRRSHPESLHSLVPHVTEAVSREFYRSDTPRSIPRHTETEFSNLLHHSVETLDRHMQRVRRFILCVLERFPDASVCHTASHSLAIGEHGMRGGHTPMSTTCTTFVSSRPSTSRCDNLDAVLSNFILDSLQLAHPPDMGRSLTSVPSLGLTRTLVFWNDHMYAVIERQGVIQNVFDLSTDPFELHDIVGNVTHLRGPLQLYPRNETHEEVSRTPQTTTVEERHEPQQPQQPQRPTPVSIPSPTASEVSTVTASTTLSRQASFSRRRTTSTTNPTQVSQNVRRAEQRLNKLHR